LAIQAQPRLIEGGHFIEKYWIWKAQELH